MFIVCGSIEKEMVECVVKEGWDVQMKLMMVGYNGDIMSVCISIIKHCFFTSCSSSSVIENRDIFSSYSTSSTVCEGYITNEMENGFLFHSCSGNSYSIPSLLL